MTCKNNINHLYCPKTPFLYLFLSINNDFPVNTCCIITYMLLPAGSPHCVSNNEQVSCTTNKKTTVTSYVL